MSELATAIVSLVSSSLCAQGMRETNQDAIGDAGKEGIACFVVADGAGGHVGGEVASRLAVESVLGSFAGNPAFGAAALRAMVEQAGERIVSDKQAAPGREDMSTTIAALLVDQQAGQAVWAHLGDTRVYLFRGGRLHSVSKDHSLTQQLIDAGYASTGQLRTHPQRNVLYAALGAGGDTSAAVSEETTVSPGDAFLLCSDGLWEWVHDDDMERTLQAALSPEDWLAALSRVAQSNAGATRKVRDNYSAYAVMVRGAPA
ncbi:PP2C family protein-serine/threonine phosphatase [Massilia cavernae]|nr:protein phosphatase 2C domain-containing protein [Massilia cavernae]